MRTVLSVAAYISTAISLAVPAVALTHVQPVGKFVAPTKQNARPVADSNVFSETMNTAGVAQDTNTLPIGYTYGAPVLVDAVNLYYIYYGTWTDAKKMLIEDFTRGLGVSDWWDTMHDYYYQQNATSQQYFVNGNLNLVKTVVDYYSWGNNLTGAALPNIIQNQINAGNLPEDSTGIYVVLTSADVMEQMRPDAGAGSAFCKDYCGYHLSWQLQSTNRIWYAMVGEPTYCPNACIPTVNQQVSPNGDLGVDAMLSVLAHEIAEAVSDPWSDGVRAWQDANLEENADKCSWSYGNTLTDLYGASYNANWSSRNYLLQRNWDLTTQSCSNGRSNKPPVANANGSTGTKTSSTSATNSATLSTFTLTTTTTYTITATTTFTASSNTPTQSSTTTARSFGGW